MGHLHVSIPASAPGSFSATHTWTRVPASKAQTGIGDFGLLFSVSLALPFLSILFEAEEVRLLKEFERLERWLSG